MEVVVQRFSDCFWCFLFFANVFARLILLLQWRGVIVWKFGHFDGKVIFFIQSAPLSGESCETIKYVIN